MENCSRVIRNFYFAQILLAIAIRTWSIDKIAMFGDSLHTDILGAAAQGWKTVLVTKDGLFSGLIKKFL